MLSCSNDKSAQVNIANELNLYLNEAVVQDSHKPPVASRIYAYPNLAMYSILRLNDEDMFPSLLSRTSLFQEIGLPKKEDNVDCELAAIVAFVAISKELVYRDHILDSCYNALVPNYNHLNEIEKENSKLFGLEVATLFIDVLSSDGYNLTREYPHYETNQDLSSWQPTPPKYFEACEPNWMLIRPFFLDSTSMFLAESHTAFDTVSSSNFYNNAMEVYEISIALTEEQKTIASFWDDNPAPMNIDGHNMKINKQLTPPGHWLRVADQLTRHFDYGDIHAAQIFAVLSMTMADAFKSVWHTKYHYDLVRPITYINKYIDQEWISYLENPMFPEYTSAHSTVSGAAAVIMTDYFGDHVSFTDSSQILYGHGTRSFDSFNEMAEEVSVSRVYGGIHYRESCDIGLEKGREIGNYILTMIYD